MLVNVLHKLMILAIDQSKMDHRLEMKEICY